MGIRKTTSEGRLDKARAAVAATEELAARWQATEATKRAELDDLEQRIGEEVIAAGEDGEAVAERLAAAAAKLRSEIDTARRAGVAAGAKIPPARAALVAEAASIVEGKLRAAEKALRAHEAKVTGLLAQLTALDGAVYVRKVATDDELRQAGTDGVHVGSSRLDELTRDVEGLRGWHDELTAAAQGAPDQATVERLIARVDPSGPEAAAVTAREHARRLAEVDAQEDGEVRDARRRHRRAALETAFASKGGDPDEAKNRAHNLLATPDQRRQHLDDDEGFRAVLTEFVGDAKADRIAADVEQQVAAEIAGWRAQQIGDRTLARSA
jgi:hypothetical protein